MSIQKIDALDELPTSRLLTMIIRCETRSCGLLGAHVTPLTLPRTRVVEAAPAGGASLAQTRCFTEFAHRPRMSRWLGVRFFLPAVNRWWARCLADAKGPILCECDTGARVHAALFAPGCDFVAPHGEMWGPSTTTMASRVRAFIGAGRRPSPRLGFVNRPSRVEIHQGELDAMGRLIRYDIDLEV